MRIITLTCDECGCIVSGEVLRRQGRVECPGLDCETVHQFDQLSDEEQSSLDSRDWQ